MFIKYVLEDGSDLWIESSESEGGIVDASVGEKFLDAQQEFTRALDSVKSSALTLRKKFEDALADEVEVTFGLKATGEVGNYIFAVGKAGMEANYTVTLKWRKKAESETRIPSHIAKHKYNRHRN